MKKIKPHAELLTTVTLELGTQPVNYVQNLPTQTLRTHRIIMLELST